MQYRCREASECLERAIAVAPRDETAIRLKLAAAYEALDDPNAAAVYHSQVIEIGESLGRGVSDYAQSCMYLARVYVTKGTPEDINLAMEILTKVSNSNAEENTMAKEALAKLEAMKKIMKKDQESP